MLALRQASAVTKACRGLATAACLQQVQVLSSSDIQQFRDSAFIPEVPTVLTQYARTSIPAIKKWFHHRNDTSVELNRTYLTRFGAMYVPLEFSDGTSFTRAQHSFSFFLECDSASRATHHAAESRYFSANIPGSKAVRKLKRDNTFFTPTSIASPQTVSIYLAQMPINDLPRDLQNDLPTPGIVRKAGRGDVYDSSIWLGRAPTYTPLHRDPNPNLFVQLAGTKTVRMFRPNVGKAIFAKVQENVGGSAAETMRGEEMMQGRERTLLEHETWAEGSEYKDLGFEAKLHTGDALFIPKGWWHSIRGTGKSMNGSVSALA